MKLKLLIFGLIFGNLLYAGIPEHLSYNRIYEFLDELSAQGFIDLNTAVKPYDKTFILHRLDEVNLQKDKLNKRQQDELKFYLKYYQLELRPSKNAMGISYLSPSVVLKDSNFTASIKPILGMQITANQKNNQIRRWYGASLESYLGPNWSFYGSLRDISHQGNFLSQASYLNQQPGYQYTVSTDYSDSRGGISYTTKWIDISFRKDNISWGDNIHGSNILSGRAPSFPALSLKIKPTSWFELNYFHAWLVSNVVDSSRYYLENETTKHYRPANKFMAANMFTFTPVKQLKISIGNSIVYAESNVIPAYFIPVAFYKSIDHTLTKGIGTENQNSQFFINLSSRNFKNLHVYSTVFVDELQIGRFLPSNDENNPISYKIGAKYYNIANSNFSFASEFTKTNIINYKHSIPTLTWASNSYNLGHYLGDNAQEFYCELQYKPYKTIDVKLSFTDARKGNEYQYIRRGEYKGLFGKIDQIIAYPVLEDIIWENQTLGIYGRYEISKDNYFILNFEYNRAQAFEPTSVVKFGEDRFTVQETLDLYTPAMMQGENFTSTLGFSFGF